MCKTKPSCQVDASVTPAMITPARKTSARHTNSADCHSTFNTDDSINSDANAKVVDFSCYDVVLGDDNPITIGDDNGNAREDGVAEELSSIRSEVRRLRMLLELTFPSNEGLLGTQRVERSERKKPSREVLALLDGFASMQCAKRRRRI